MRRVAVLVLALASAATLIAATPSIASAQPPTIAACPDCARTSPCPLCKIIAECCFYESTNSPRCSTRQQEGWSIEECSCSPCQTYIDNSGNGVCRGPRCDGGEESCQCEPGYVGPPGNWGNCDEGAGTDACGCCQEATPIIVDLGRDGIRMSSALDGAMFDINGLGRVFWVGWPADSGDAWLALDRNGNGRIDSGAELFGNATILSNGRAAADGYRALAELDSNGDGGVSSNDFRFTELVLWIDANRNGIGEAAELVPISNTGIVFLSTDARESRKHDRWGNLFKYRAKVIWQDGKQDFSYDVFPVTAPVSGVTQASVRRCEARGEQSNP